MNKEDIKTMKEWIVTYLYARGRSSAVHEMGFATVLDKREAVFERNKQGDDIYFTIRGLAFTPSRNLTAA